MGRPTKYSRDAILDAALALFAEEGVEAIRVSRIAERLGAPSGSIYHRFPSRVGLAAALWNRTVAQFQDTLAEVFEASEEVSEARAQLLRVARRSLRWCAEHPAEASLLQAGPSVAGPGAWPADALEERETRQAWLQERMGVLADRLALPPTRVMFALVDMTYAAVRRQLKHPSELWEQLAMEAIERLLPPPVELVGLDVGEEDRFRRLRLMSLLDAPEAFCSDFDEVVARPRESWTQQLRDLPTVVAVMGGRDVGMVRRMVDAAGRQWLLSMWVAPHARGRGVGGLLVQAVVDGARADSAERVGLEVRQENHAAMALYGRHGFVRVGVTDAGDVVLERTL